MCILGTCLQINRWRTSQLIQSMTQTERHNTLVIELQRRGVTFIQNQENEELIQTCAVVAQQLSKTLVSKAPALKPKAVPAFVTVKPIHKSVNFQTQPLDLEHSEPIHVVQDFRAHPKPKADVWDDEAEEDSSNEESSLNSI